MINIIGTENKDGEDGDGGDEGGDAILRPDEKAFVKMLGDDAEADVYLQLLIEEEEAFLKNRKKLNNKKLSEEEEKKLDVIRYAYTLLRDQYGGIAEIAKVNPLAVLSFTRAILTDHIPAHSVKVAAAIAALHRDEINAKFEAILQKTNQEHHDEHKPKRPRP